jgi:hypothetical protein
MAADPEVKHKFVMDNPPYYKPLAKTREANARWRHYAKQKRKLRAPFLQKELEYAQRIANGEIRIEPMQPKIREQLEEEMTAKRAQTGRYQGKFRTVSSRFIRRRYQALLSDYVPTISDTDGKWSVTQVHRSAKYPQLDPSHRAGYLRSDGSSISGVDENGAIIKDQGA